MTELNEIPGWFHRLDQAVFEHFLGTDALVSRGDLVELGAYLGKSAVLIGRFKRPDETFTVCDLFETPPEDESNRRETSRSYSGLAREQFERNYLSFFNELPVIVQDFSSAIVDHVKPGSARFVHVDASHLYEHVSTDVESARRVLLPDAVVAFDDYRSAHTPGVAAAVWEAVFTKDLHLICLTPHKLYATFGDPEPHQQRLQVWLASASRIWWETQVIGAAPVIRMREKKLPGPSAPAPTAPKPAVLPLLRRLPAAAARRLRGR